MIFLFSAGELQAHQPLANWLNTGKIQLVEAQDCMAQPDKVAKLDVTSVLPYRSVTDTLALPRHVRIQMTQHLTTVIPGLVPGIQNGRRQDGIDGSPGQARG